ncbi:hypothetical protein MMAGJ_24080 [Mycolicibacterium mageritense]|uniref:Uncharacterized protein n=2 Tax=Mycolicibacterium mageritense TaxID=53462 RepID=A0ABM7HRE7_MYCME|nr:hypothetical protein MMAGJ_24080 [Mycolicibacterium mageritense]
MAHGLTPSRIERGIELAAHRRTGNLPRRQRHPLVRPLPSGALWGTVGVMLIRFRLGHRERIGGRIVRTKWLLHRGLVNPIFRRLDLLSVGFNVGWWWCLGGSRFFDIRDILHSCRSRCFDNFRLGRRLRLYRRTLPTPCFHLRE